MASNLDWALAMEERLMEALNPEIDERSRQLIGQMFLAGLAQYDDVLEELKSSSLIESNYFDDDEQPEDRTIIGNRYKITIKGAAKKH
jgi:hypothetical protein